MRNHFKTKLCNRNSIKKIKTWAVLLLRYSGPFLNEQGQNSDKWTKGQESWWLFTSFTSQRWHRLYASRKEDGNCIDASTQGFKNCIKKNRKRLITSVNNNSINDIIIIIINVKRKTAKTRKQKWEVKQLYGY